MSGWVTVMRLAVLELALEDRQDAAGRAEDVAEPDRDVRPAGPHGGVRDEPLGEALGRAHDARRLDGLVGRDEDEARDAGGDRGRQDRQSCRRY